VQIYISTGEITFLKSSAPTTKAKGSMAEPMSRVLNRSAHKSFTRPTFNA